MKRKSAALAVTVALWGCDPENNAQRCDGKADFVVSLSSPTDVLPSDTRIQVTFGGGSMESYQLGASNDPEVLFCETTPAGATNPGIGGTSGEDRGTPEAGAGGSAWARVGAITCEIWSAGPASLTIRAAAWRTTRELKPDPELCTLSKSIVFGEPDPKP